MQVFPELVCIVVNTMKIIKLHKSHFIAMVYKTAFGNINDIIAKQMIPWNKSKLHDANNNKKT